LGGSALDRTRVTTIRIDTSASNLGKAVCGSSRCRKQTREESFSSRLTGNLQGRCNWEKTRKKKGKTGGGHDRVPEEEARTWAGLDEEPKGVGFQREGRLEPVSKPEPLRRQHQGEKGKA